MPEFQLYKKRNFSAYINDLIQFFKIFGKNYFKNYLIVNGGLLLVFCAFFYFVYRDFLENIMQNTFTNNWIFADENLPLMFFMGIIFIIISVVLGIMNIGFPLVYVKQFEKNGHTNVKPSVFVNEIFNHAMRILGFGFKSFFTIFLLMMIFMIIGVVLSFLLIGIPILLIGFPAMMVWSFQAMIIYIYEDVDFFESLGKSWKVLFSNFWHIVGSMVIVYLFIYIVQLTITMVPYFIMLGSFITSGANPNSFSFPPIITALYILSFLVSFFSMNFLYVQQILVYYSAKEKTENIQAISEIDKIGLNED